MTAAHLEIAGAVAAGGPLQFDRERLAALPAAARVDDIGASLPGRRGTAVRLSAVVAAAPPAAGVRHVRVVARDGSFETELPIDESLADAWLVHSLDGADLPAEFGGPFRLFVVDGRDACRNVKDIGRLVYVEPAGDAQ